MKEWKPRRVISEPHGKLAAGLRKESQTPKIFTSYVSHSHSVPPAVLGNRPDSHGPSPLGHFFPPCSAYLKLCSTQFYFISCQLYWKMSSIWFLLHSAHGRKIWIGVFRSLYGPDSPATSKAFGELSARGLSLPPASQKGEIFHFFFFFFYLPHHPFEGINKYSVDYLSWIGEQKKGGVRCRRPEVLDFG